MFVMDEPLNEPNENKDVLMETGNTKLNGSILNNDADGDVEMEDLSESNNGSSLKFVKSPPTSVLSDITKQTCAITNGHISEENMDCDGEEEESNDNNSSHNVTNDSISNRDFNLKEKPSENDLGKDNDIINHNHSSTLLNGETNVIEKVNSLIVEKENSVNIDENVECLDLSSASQSLPDSSKDFNAIKNVANNFNRDKQMDHKVENRETEKTEINFSETKTEDAKITSTIEDDTVASSKITALDNESREDGKQKLADSIVDENMFNVNEEKDSSDELSTAAAVTPRRSSRNINKQKTNSEKDEDETDQSKSTTSVVDDDIEEITPTDPLADESSSKVQSNKPIVVNDAKGLVEFASNSKQIKSNKKEPTLVIIDTNSILSGRGPVPISQSSNTVGSGVNSYSNTSVSAVRFNSSQPSTPLPATSAVGTSTNHLYPTVRNPPQMKPLVITPVTTSVSNSPANTTTTVSSTTPKAPVILPSLTDDMFVVEAPSFIVPYVYEKPPMKSLKEFVEKLIQEVKEMIKEQETSETESKTTADKLDEGNEVTEKTDEKLAVSTSDLIDKSKEANESAAERMDIDEVDESTAKQPTTTSNVTDENVKIKDEPEDKLNEVSEKVENTCDSSAGSPFGEGKKDDIKLEAEDLSVEKQSAVKKENEIKKEEQQPLADGSAADKKVNENDTAEKIKKPTSGNSFFDNPLGKFFMQIGLNLVQEYVQTDLLRSQRRKRDKEGNRCPQDVLATIESLSRTLEFSRETNDPFRLTYRKCELCSFKTESVLAMVHHLETPHMKNYTYRCNFCPLEVRSPHDILYHMEAEHNVRGRLERAPAFHQCPNCPFEDNQKGKLTRHLSSCCKKYRPERNQEPPLDWEQPAKIPRVTRNRPPAAMNPGNAVYQAAISGMKQVQQNTLLPKLMPSASNLPPAMINKNRPKPLSNLINRFPNNGGPQPSFQPRAVGQPTLSQGLLFRPTGSNGQPPVMLQPGYPQIYQNTPQNLKQTQPPSGLATNKLLHQPSISITPLPRQSSTTPPSASSAPTPSASSSPNLASSAKAAVKPPAANTNNRSNSNNAFVICEICDGYIKDLEQLRNHMQWIHKVKIHPKMIYNRPPLNCQKCQFRFFTDQGLERHLLGSHGLVTSSMQEAANKGKDGGRCPVCGRVYQWKLLNHVARDHNMALKPAHLSYKCTVCTATFGMYKQFESHVYSAHSVVAKRAIENKKTPMPPPPTPAASSPSTSTSAQNETMLKPLKITDEITIIPQPARVAKSTNSKNASTNPTSSRSKDNERSQYSCIICEQIFCEQQQYQDHVIEQHMKKFSIVLPRIDDDAIVTVEADIENFLALDQDDLVPPNDQCKSFWIELPMIDDDGKKLSVPHLPDNAKLPNSTSTVTPVALNDSAGNCVIVETFPDKNVNRQSGDAHSNLPLTPSISLEENYCEYEEEEEGEEFSCFEQLMRYGHFLGRARCRWSNNKWNDHIRQWMDKLNKRSAAQNKLNRMLPTTIQKVVPSQVVKRVIPIRPRAQIINAVRRDNPIQQRYFVVKPPQIRQPQSAATAVHHVQQQTYNRLVVTNRPNIFKYKFVPVRPGNVNSVMPTFFNAEQCIGETGVGLSTNKNESNGSSNSQNTPSQSSLTADNFNNISNNRQMLIRDNRNIIENGANFRPEQQLCFAIVTNNNSVNNKYSDFSKTVVPVVGNSTIIDLCDDDDITGSADNTNSNGSNCQLVTTDMIEQEILGI